MAELGLPGGGRLDPPRGLRLYDDRRPLRVQPRGAEAEWHDGALHLAFELPAGSYTTVLVEELSPEGFEEGPGD